MDRLWTPWRFNYITGAQPSNAPGDDRPTRKGVPAQLSAWPGPDDGSDDTGCVFCNMLGAVAWAKSTGMPAEAAEQAAFIITMRSDTFVCLNAFPYSSGHLLILPYQHIASLAAIPLHAARQMLDLAREAENALRTAYRPDGLNLGINMGESAGAGVAGHLHLHALPRWTGDASFITTVGETRVLPENLEDTWRKLRMEITKGQPQP